MTGTLSERLEALLRRVLTEIPAEARQIDFDLPSTIHPSEHPDIGTEGTLELDGREVNLFAGHPESRDTLLVQWNTPDRILERLQYRIPEDAQLSQAAHLAYHHARKGGTSSGDCLLAAMQHEELAAGAQEIYLRLLADGTDWPRAAQFAEEVEDGKPGPRT